MLGTSVGIDELVFAVKLTSADEDGSVGGTNVALMLAVANPPYGGPRVAEQLVLPEFAAVCPETPVPQLAVVTIPSANKFNEQPARTTVAINKDSFLTLPPRYSW
jgi:hypothetical protein